MSLQFPLPFPTVTKKVKKKYIAQAWEALLCPFVRYLKSHLHTVIIFHDKNPLNMEIRFFSKGINL